MPFPSPGDLPDPGIEPRDRTQGSNPGIEPRSPALQADALLSELPGKPAAAAATAAAAAAKSRQSCPTLCDPIDSSPPGSPVSGILQARTLEWVAMSSNA